MKKFFGVKKEHSINLESSKNLVLILNSLVDWKEQGKATFPNWGLGRRKEKPTAIIKSIEKTIERVVIRN